MDRIKQLCSYLTACESFADVACDHGYIAEYMLKNRLCSNVVVSDISLKCLNKAQELLTEYIKSGLCHSVCCDGLEKIEPETQCVVIAGIGGEEIIRILKDGFIPKTFLFQPMKNAEKLRAFLIENGCYIEKDDIFNDGANYYFVIQGRRGEAQNYDDIQLKYGKDSLHNPVFYEFLEKEILKKRAYLSGNLSSKSRNLIDKQIKQMEGILKSEIKRNT